MREKLRDEQGLTLVEMLCAVAILVLLGLLLNTGLQMAVRSYQDITAQSEVQLLLSTLSDALADDLRYARDVKVDSNGTLASYNSDSYNSDSYDGERRATLGFTLDGPVMAGDKRVLPSGAYGNGAYGVKDMTITYNEGFFKVYLKVGQKEGTICAETTFTVRCLSEAGGTGEEGGG